MYRIKKSSWSKRPADDVEQSVESLLPAVDKGSASLKAQIGMHDDITVEITPDSGDYYYRGHFNMTWDQFNKKYGKDYISKYNLYF